MRNSIHDIIILILGIILIGIIINPVALMLVDTLTTHEVETYAFHAVITDKAIVDEYRHPREYLLFFVDGEEAGAVDVLVHEYARYAVGDLVRIEAVVTENIFNFETVFYNLGVDN